MASKPTSPPPHPAASAVQALCEILSVQADLLCCLSSEHYSAKPVGIAGASNSIGAHIRHCHDHVRALLDGIDTGLVAYDRRERGTELETDRDLAIAALREMEDRLKGLPVDRLEEQVGVELTVSCNAPPIETSSTVMREVGFVISHSVHHNALLAIIAGYHGYEVPEAFAYAPSTLAWMKGIACAPAP